MLTPLKRKKTPRFVPLHTSVSFVSRAVLTVRNQPKTLRGIFHQMDHTWWAPNRLKKSTRLKMRSLLSLTLFHSFIVTLYIRRIYIRIVKFNIDSPNIDSNLELVMYTVLRKSEYRFNESIFDESIFGLSSSI